MDELQAIRRVLGTTRRHNVRSITWFGNKICSVDDEFALERLTEVLYAQAYTLGHPVPLQSEPPARPDPHWRRLSPDPRLSACWSGWTHTTLDTVRQPGRPTLVVKPNQIQDSRDGQTSVILPSYSTRAIPGWLLVRHGDTTLASPTVRIYANTESRRLRETLPHLLGVLLASYDHFSAKFLATDGHGRRADSTVLYLPYHPSPDVLADICQTMAGALARSAVPMFTRRICDGVAFAPSPSDGSSFGMTVCRSLAGDFLSAIELNPPTRALRFPAVARFSAHADKGQLGTMSNDSVSASDHGNARGAVSQPGCLTRPEPVGTGGAQRLPNARDEEREDATRKDPTEDLLRYTRTLDDAALTSGGQATWICLDDDGTHKALDASTYSGLAGPLLVLAYSFALDARPVTRRLLRATATSMLERHSELPTHGFHGGQAGTAATLAEAASISRDEHLRETAEKCLERVLPRVTQTTTEWDLITGLSGTIIALTAASSLLQRDVASFTAALGTRLKAMCETTSADLVRWRFRSGRRSATLASLAHGGTGAALALALSPRATTDTNDLIGRTIRFEDEHRTDARGWLDYRTVPLLEPATVWCHGSAGIGVGTVALIDALRRAQRGHTSHSLIPTEETAGRSTKNATSDFTLRVRVAYDRTCADLENDIDDGLCHGTSGQVLCSLLMARHLGESFDYQGALEILRGTRRPPRSDFRLSKGRPGTLIASLALVHAAQPPLFVSLLPLRA